MKAVYEINEFNLILIRNNFEKMIKMYLDMKLEAINISKIKKNWVRKP